MQVSKPLKVHILGTDTDVGKTWVCYQLFKALNSLSVTCCPAKPIHSGWSTKEKWGSDFMNYGNFLDAYTPDQLNAYRFTEPMSPHAASHFEKVSIDLAICKQFWKNLDKLIINTVLVEGIGGICCPLAEDLTYLEFLNTNRAPCILVSKVGLGSLNHAIMSYRLLKQNGHEILGVVLNPETEFDKNDKVFSTAKWELETQLNTTIYGPLKRNDSSIPKELIALAKRIALLCTH